MEVSDFEGLVGKTAEMFSAMVGLEVEDMRQELFVKVVKAQRAYDPTRSSMTERAYVYACLANFVKDLKRDAARRSVMPVSFIEDCRGPLLDEIEGTDYFEFRYMNLSRDEAYAEVEDRFVLPATVTEAEAAVLRLLMAGYAQTEIAPLLGVSLWQVMDRVRKLKDKLADWRPSPQPSLTTLPQLESQTAVAA